MLGGGFLRAGTTACFFQQCLLCNRKRNARRMGAHTLLPGENSQCPARKKTITSNASNPPPPIPPDSFKPPVLFPNPTTVVDRQNAQTL